MSDSLVYVAVVLSVLGIILLAFVSEYLSPAYTGVRDVDSEMLEKVVRLKGVVGDVYVFKGGSAVLTLIEEDGSSVSVYLPYSVSTSVNASSLRKKTVDVVGVVQIYEGELEVVVNGMENLVVL